MHISCSFLAVFGTLGIIAGGSFMALIFVEEEPMHVWRFGEWDRKGYLFWGSCL